MKNLSRNRISMLAIGLVVSLIFGIMLIQSNHLNHQLDVYAMKTEAVQAKIEEENQRTKEIDELKEYMKTDAYAEEVARDKLGLVKDNEIVFQEKEADAN